MTEKSKNDNADELRRKAEEKISLQKKEAFADGVSSKTTLHELHVYQIELEMQNDELRRAKAELEESRARYCDLYEFAPMGYLTVSEKELILSANLTAAKLLGITRNELENQPLTRFIIQEDVDIPYLRGRQLYETGQRQVYDLRLIKKGGGQVWTRFDEVLAKDTDDTLVRRIAISDITAEKEAAAAAAAAIAAEKLARDRADILLLLYTQAPQLTDRELYDFTLEKATEITKSSIGFLHLLSDDQKDIILTTWNSEALKTCTASYETHYPLEKAGNWCDCVRLKRPIVYNNFATSPNQKGLPEGHSSVRRFMSIPVIEDDKVRIIFGVGNKAENYDDIDVVQMQLIANELHKIVKQRHAEKQLKEATARATAANEAKSRFLATMSHDLRTPLNAVIGFSEFALLDSGENALSPKHKENIAHVATAGRHLLNLVEGLLNVAAIESGKITLEREFIDLKAMLEELSKTYEMLAKKSGITWHCDIIASKRVFVDWHRIREVINNLVSNSLKFTPVGGAITLGAREDENAVTIFVRDTGCGIEKVDLEEIFKPFMQCNNPGVYNQGKGVGLGLAICQQLVELHGGKLTVESEKDKGSCFMVTLPYTEESA